jgi:hypothetical protein
VLLILKLDSETNKNLSEYMANECSYIQDISYEIKDDGDTIQLRGCSSIPDSDTVLKIFNDLEKILNAKYVCLMSLNGTYILTFKFNK